MSERAGRGVGGDRGKGEGRSLLRTRGCQQPGRFSLGPGGNWVEGGMTGDGVDGTARTRSGLVEQRSDHPGEVRGCCGVTVGGRGVFPCQVVGGVLLQRRLTHRPLFPSPPTCPALWPLPSVLLSPCHTQVRAGLPSQGACSRGRRPCAVRGGRRQGWAFGAAGGEAGPGL